MLDENIIELYNKRSEDAISETAKKYGKVCQTVAYNVLKNTQDAEECVNDTYLNTWNAIPPERPNSLISFLCLITRNLALDRYRGKTAKSRTNGQPDLIFEELSECISDSKTSDDDIENILRRDVINRFLAALNEENRDMFVLRYWYMYSIADIARLYHFSENKVSVSLFRIRKSLKLVLEKEGVY